MRKMDRYTGIRLFSPQADRLARGQKIVEPESPFVQDVFAGVVRSKIEAALQRHPQAENREAPCQGQLIVMVEIEAAMPNGKIVSLYFLEQQVSECSSGFETTEARNVLRSVHSPQSRRQVDRACLLARDLYGAFHI